MKIIKTLSEMKSYTAEKRREHQTIGFVPTMGYLHQGHLALMQAARKDCAVVIASIFVNPIQFGIGEDYEEYPRDLTRDGALAESVGVDAIFAPSVGEMYPKGYHTFVHVESLTDYLCGASRPGHFRGVTTVVAKLFNIIQPDLAYFGQKDAQQVTVIERMVEDLNMNVKIVRVPIVREEDGLAMSSRNVYLNPEERKQALVLSRSLAEAKSLVEKGERDAKVAKDRIRDMISQAPLARIDYIEIVDGRTMEPVEILRGKVLIALAVKFGKTRLIDNVLLEV
ncbi:pantoate--beta-alanine ligase [Candidatus Formimonas warabiya]|uniref:Pantothenate synthetase n=1 Tax=Formimonas warabiya TaxID=1761012 RepID=A0A3G1KX69_FORW1|nr:pantoate--beta-alanine ligase [Candidatus Formimonas warabiya]ATW27056.1 pantoate--beta-alanine ligase [Candidatus Formimonas warabiya]